MTRLAIPSALKRDVRQKCKFCCVLCGSPIYDYEHVEPYATVKEHTLENLVLLCPTCHRKKTNGLVTKTTIINALKEVNRDSRSSPDEVLEEVHTFDIGNNKIFSPAGYAFSIEGFGDLRVLFKNGRVEINAKITDPMGRDAIRIEDNIYTLLKSTWDIEYVGNTLTFRNAPRKVFACISFDMESKLISIRGSCTLKSGTKVEMRNDGIYANGFLLAKENHFFNCKVGLVITEESGFIGAIAGSSVQDNHFVQFGRIAVINSLDCSGNRFSKCNICILWEMRFLDSLSVI